MADNQFAERAAKMAVERVEEKLIKAQRQYEDAMRFDDDISASKAFEKYVRRKEEYDRLTGAGQQQQQQQQPGLSVAQRNFLSRRAAGGDELTPQRMKDYGLAHTRAVNAGLQVDSPEYFAAIERYADTMGDGRQPPLNEREAARISGISEQEYAANAAKLRALKAAGHYRDE